MGCVLALDQGTTSSRAILFAEDGTMLRVAQREFTQFYPAPGWVEHDPAEIWKTQLAVAEEVLQEAGDVAAVGITNQRETTMVWDRRTGAPVCNAIVWQDRRTAGFCDELRRRGLEDNIREKTGLVIDAYFSASKVRWILENVPGAREKAQRGELLFGTIDTWLLWKLTAGRVHATDVSNASRTMLYNIRQRRWDDELLELFGIPQATLPAVKPSSGIFGETDAALFDGRKLKIAGAAGDQQAALFGQACFSRGLAKNTYGTGCFMLMNVGTTPPVSEHRLLTTVAWEIDGVMEYALEGSVFVGGAVVQWLRDGLGLIKSAAEVEALAKSVADSGGVYMVPAFAGLGAPHWDAYARGTVMGITRGTTAGHFARAALESIGFQVAELLEVMVRDSGIPMAELRVDGGAASNDLLLQFQADLLGVPVVRPQVTETTALGAAYLAGLGVGFWKSREDLGRHWKVGKMFEPKRPQAEMEREKSRWRRALERAKGWEEAG